MEMLRVTKLAVSLLQRLGFASPEVAILPHSLKNQAIGGPAQNAGEAAGVREQDWATAACWGCSEKP
ncbi:MAG: hypothetical protein EA424_03960 [Planctomycetaceae bacterium]|nr:MAG: hypothetical protein EA424_03960 [Planctomycetaceae bacterium]